MKALISNPCVSFAVLLMIVAVPSLSAAQQYTSTDLGTLGGKLNSRIVLIILALLISSVGTHVSAQQTKPNLTGTWKINLSKSKLAPQHGPGIDRYKIKHSEPRVEMQYTFNGRSETYIYVTDGKERTANGSLQDGPTRAKTNWDGDTLVIEKHQATGHVGAFVWISRFSLSQDGKSLAVTHHANQSSFGAAIDESLVYEKED
jgi:hypothetical protein